jgi:DNA processing protein
MDSISLLCLMNLRGVGRRTAWAAAADRTFKACDAGDILRWLEQQSRNNKRIPVPSMIEVDQAWSEAERNQDVSLRLGIKVLNAREKDYPRRLAMISDPPPVLFVKGDIVPLQGEIMIAIIGTREPSEFGLEAGRRISAFLACSGAVIVSGLARGCDTTGHRGCIDAEGRTIAVLAHGLDTVHPRENTRLAEEIVSSGGCLVSEYKTGTKPARNFFVERDRLQSGLSDAVIVIETGTTGGTLHTARFCLEQKRKLATLRHTEKWRSHEKAQGNDMLRRESKAIGLADKEEVNSFLMALKKEKLENDHCDHWFDDVDPQPDMQLSVF